MAYTKTTWASNVLVTPARLRNLESQHELLLVDARVENEPLLVELASTSTEAGSIHVNTTDDKLYGYNGTAWIMLGVD